MKPAQVLVIAPPREADAWAPALRAAGLEPSSARSRKEAGPVAARVAPSLVLVSAKLALLGPLGAIRDLRKDPATREIPVVLVGTRPFTISQRMRMGLSLPDATVAKGASPQAVAQGALDALRAGRLPIPELTPAQQAAMKYSKLANLLMVMGVFFAMPTGSTAQGIDRSWFMELIPLGGLVSDIAIGRVDGRKGLLSWQGWAAVGFIAAIALGILFWPAFFRLR